MDDQGKRNLIVSLAILVLLGLGASVGSLLLKSKRPEPRRPSDEPKVLVETPRSPSPTPITAQAVLGPGGCGGIESLIEKTRSERLEGSKRGGLVSRSDRLGEYVFLESPYPDFETGYTGSITDPTQGRRYGDLAGFRTGYSRTFIAREPGETGTGPWW